MLFECQNVMNIEVTGFLVMHLGFSLDSSNIYLKEIDLSGRDLDMLDTVSPANISLVSKKF